MNTEFNARLLGFLSPVETRSGKDIAAELECSRTAVWKHIESLRSLGINIVGVAGQGYRLREHIELLEEGRIRACLSSRAATALTSLELLPVVDSTNSWLQSQPLDWQAGVAVLAECQTAGRGRRGQQWVSPYGRNIYFSLGWRFESGIGELGCLPLLLALSACDALDEAGLQGHGVKWPNDVQLDRQKLGGCLVEVQGDASGPCHAVLGVGINVCMPASTPESDAIDQPWTDVSSHLPDVSRNLLAGGLLNALLIKLDTFAVHGFEPFMDLWEARDVLAGKEVELVFAGESIPGISKGISSKGGLLLQTMKGVAEYFAGEVSVARKGIQD